MTVTQIDLDDDALAAAMRISGSHTKKEAVNFALRELAAREQRLAAWDSTRETAQSWDYEGWKQLREAEDAPYR